MKDNTALKRIAHRPADPKLITPEPVTTGAAAKEQSQLRLQAFDDGFIFKFTAHPEEPDKFVLFDTGNRPVAITQSAPIADLLCQAVRMLFHAVEASKQSAPGTKHNPTDVRDGEAPNNVVRAVRESKE